jgi:chromosome segregation ATPase
MAAAESANPEEDRMRAALKESTLQLRAAQSDLASLQSSQATLAEEKKTVTEKYEFLKKQAAADRTTWDKTMAELQAEVAAQKASLARLNEALQKSRSEGTKATEVGRDAEARSAKLTLELQALRRQVAELEGKNLALFLLGNEILGRYEDFSLGNALSAKEPFVGKTRAKLENLVQAYQDKLLDQRAH